MKTSQQIDHEGLFLIPGEGLAGGGPLTQSQGLRLDVAGLEYKAPQHAEDLVVYFDPLEGQHFKCRMKEFGEFVVGMSSLPDEVRALREEVKGLRKVVDILSVYERIERLEKGER